ncbi:hypothetical protein EYF80_033662 [Liparis tanakae]|uniref:Uncharacterized protein n=1 Tax=Liparis tanakae TaxID=230148 RepID=A0A4Z2GTQ0_9TELE|nr:hypothetical protein EYF80_033662 [Liparis tanakae]
METTGPQRSNHKSYHWCVRRLTPKHKRERLQAKSEAGHRHQLLKARGLRWVIRRQLLCDTESHIEGINVFTGTSCGGGCVKVCADTSLHPQNDGLRLKTFTPKAAAHRVQPTSVQLGPEFIFEAMPFPADP